MMALVLRGDALRLPLPDESVDLIVTSPPYFALRSYRDGDEHYDGQIGSEATSQDFLEALWTTMDECWRVLKPTGSAFINLGDKYAGSGGHNNAGVSAKSTLRGNGHVGGGPKIKATRRSAPDRYNQAADVQVKSLMGLPWEFALGCIKPKKFRTPDDHQWILRAEIIHDKRNGLPESVRDRVHRKHEQWFHLTREPVYFSAVDEIREPHTGGAHPSGPNAAVANWESGNRARHRTGRSDPDQFDPRGKMPGSVWSIPSEPLHLPDELGVDHFAAFSSEWPRRLIVGWSPSGVCVECGEGRRPVVAKTKNVYYGAGQFRSGAQQVKDGAAQVGWRHDEKWRTEAAITGYTCACPEPSAPTHPAVILDPFGGTGTVAMVARMLGRIGISVDLSADYCRLARWRIFAAPGRFKTLRRTYEEAQGTLW